MTSIKQTQRKPTSAVIYCRVSSQVQSQYGDGCVSLQAQESVCRDYCVKNNIPIDSVVHEVGSGRDMTKLRLLNRVVRKLEPGTVVVFYNITRFSRNVYQALTLLNTITKKLCTVYAVGEQCNYNDSAQQNLFRNTLCFAQNESNQISERVRNSVTFRRIRGDFFGSAPYGKRIARDKNMRRILEANPDEIAVIRRIKALYDQKVLPADIAHKLNKKNILRRNKLWTANYVAVALAANRNLSMKSMQKEISKLELVNDLDDLLKDVGSKRGAATFDEMDDEMEDESSTTSKHSVRARKQPERLTESHRKR
jgi:DNA invertase Pin-like site-specific DNA recombinase